MSKTIIQNQFYAFHDNIKLDESDFEDLREKKDMLIEELEKYFKKKATAENKPQIRFTVFTQGSYPMGTGNRPAYDEQDYDFDIGLLFHVSIDDYSPIELKRMVYEALDSKQFRTVEWKKACIRVQYVEEGLPKFHVDFACYSEGNSNVDGKTYIAKGTPTLDSNQNKWEESEPKKLKTLINNKFTNVEEKSQFKRIIRGKKRWKDENFQSKNGTPTGIALTALAYNGFTPIVKNSFNGQPDVNDHQAMLDFVKYIIRQFRGVRISVALPVMPYNDLFEKMTDAQCVTFKEKLEKLRDALEDALDEADPHDACKIIRRQLGKDFPVPSKEQTSQKRTLAVAGTSESA